MKKGSKTLLAAVLSFSIILSCAPFGVSGAANAPPDHEQDSFLSQVWPGFENPSQDHMTTPLWFWNEAIETMSADRVREIVRESYEQSGYNGFGILPAFLSTADNYVFENEKFFEMYEAALDEASKYGMKVALYDEDGWPSGAAGGLVKRDHPEYTTRRLDKAEAEGAGGSAVVLPTFSGDYLGAVMMNTETMEVVDISSEVKEAFDGFEASAAPFATASSIYSGAYKADYAVDGKEETRWNALSGQAMPQWVELNFTKPVSFDKVEIIQPYKENPVLNRITSYGIEYYDESAQQWVEIKSGGTIGNSVTDTFDSVTASRMRIVVKKVSASSPSIAEIKVYDGDNELTPFGVKPDGPSYTIPQREGNWKVMVFSCAIQGNKGVDYLNPDAVKAYIGYTYDEFYERFGEYFGTTITKSFYDEPTLKQFREAGTSGNRTWTPNFNAMFEERYPGENPMLYYPALFYDIGAATQEARDKLYTARSDMFATSFIKQMNDWCTDKGIQYMGHLYSEETVNPVSISGDLMRTFKYQSIPGVDHIGNANNTHQISRVITSSAYNWDKPLVMSETYGAAGANMPVGDLYRWAMDEFAAGVNYIVPHAVWYNDKVNVFYPPELSYRNEKYAAELKPYNTYVARLNQMLQGGRHVADIGIVYPIDYLESSFVMNAGDCNPADADYETVLTTLTQSIRKDITFLHPEVIDEKCTVDPEAKTFNLNNEVNYERYNTLVLPGMKVISLSNLQKVKAFYDAGGTVISTTQLPFEGITEAENEQVRAIVQEMFGVDPETKQPLDGSDFTTFHRQSNQAGGKAYYTLAPTDANLRAILEDTETVFDISFPALSAPGGRFTYIHKVQQEQDVFFLANTSTAPISSVATVRGEISPVIWDPHTGEKSRPQFEVTQQNGVTVTKVQFTLGSDKSLLLVDESLTPEEEALLALTDALKNAKLVDQDKIVRGKIELNRAIAQGESILAAPEGYTSEQMQACTRRLLDAVENVIYNPQANRALHAAVTANSSYENNTAWGASRLTDGQIAAGGWTSNNTNTDPKLMVWAQLDLNGAQTFDQIVLYPRQDYPVKPFPKTFWLETSDNGTDWEVLYEGTDCPEVTTNDPLIIPLSEPVTARYFRFRCTDLRPLPGSGAGVVGVQLAEIELYNTKFVPYAPEYEVIVQQPEHGTVSVDRDIFLEGDSLLFVAVPDKGYQLSNWVINGEAVQAEGNEYRMEDVRDNITLSAEFTRLELNTDKTILNKVIAYAQEQAEDPAFSKVIEQVQATFLAALDAAAAVAEDEVADQSEIDAAWMNLMREIHKLGFVQGDKFVLTLLTEAAEELSAHLDRYTPSSVQPFVPALEGAQRTLSDGNAMQQEVDEAASALLDAMLGLRYRADKALLNALLDQAGKLDLAAYTPESVAAFCSARDAAQQVSLDPDAEQQETDAAVAALDCAVRGLQKLPVAGNPVDPTANRSPRTGEAGTAAAAAALFTGAGILLLGKKRR